MSFFYTVPQAAGRQTGNQLSSAAEPLFAGKEGIFQFRTEFQSPPEMIINILFAAGKLLRQISVGEMGLVHPCFDHAEGGRIFDFEPEKHSDGLRQSGNQGIAERRIFIRKIVLHCGIRAARIRKAVRIKTYIR